MTRWKPATVITRADFLAMQITDVFLPEDIPRLTKFVKGMAPDAQSSTTWRQQTPKAARSFGRRSTPTGSLYQGETARLVVVNDASERRETEVALRQAERNYRSIFENAVEGIFQTSPAGQYLSANPALARIYGYDSPGRLDDASDGHFAAAVCQPCRPRPVCGADAGARRRVRF